MTHGNSGNTVTSAHRAIPCGNTLVTFSNMVINVTNPVEYLFVTHHPSERIGLSFRSS